MALTHYDVIYVDDDQPLTQIFNTYVQMAHIEWTYESYTDSRTAYELVEENMIGARVWLLDIMMPGKNGIELAVLIQQIDPRATILGYTALDPLDVKMKYGKSTTAFTKIISKNESIMDILSLLDVYLK